jgi:AcrR family transcriptional regulator
MTEPSLQDRRRDYTAGLIARAALKLFAERSFDAVTIEDIASEVGMSSRTFFRYFSSKDEVVMRSHRRLNARLATVFIERADTEPPITALRNAYRVTSTVAPDDHDEYVQVGRFLMESPTLLTRSRGEQATGNDALIAAVAHKLGADPRHDPTAETVVTAMGTVASAAFYRWITTGGRGDLSEQVVAAIDLLIAGLAALDRGAQD